MLESSGTARGRVGLALLTSLIVVVLSVLLFRDALPILPALLVAVWVPVYARPQPAARRVMLVLSGALIFLAGLGVLVFFLIEI